jgi:hypothetical protein
MAEKGGEDGEEEVEHAEEKRGPLSGSSVAEAVKRRVRREGDWGGGTATVSGEGGSSGQGRCAAAGFAVVHFSAQSKPLWSLKLSPKMFRRAEKRTSVSPWQLAVHHYGGRHGVERHRSGGRLPRRPAARQLHIPGRGLHHDLHSSTSQLNLSCHCHRD